MHDHAMASNSEPRLAELLSPQKYYPIFALVSSYLRVADFLALYRVSKDLHALKDDIQRAHWNVNIRLNDFVTEPDRSDLD
jgi:hypothetical protein